jgi:hypothetical protein
MHVSKSDNHLFQNRNLNRNANQFEQLTINAKFVDKSSNEKSKKVH